MALPAVFRGCREPANWPVAPDEITFSSLSVIEACPRQWALQAAHYPDLWEGRGYPPKIIVKGLTGTIAHSVVEKLTREFVAAGCGGIDDPFAIDVMRSLGGYTRMIARSIEVIAARCRQNPRASRIQEHLEQSLYAKVPEIRGQVQGLLSHVRFHGKHTGRRIETGVAGIRRPLRAGVHAELVLRAPSIHWKGKVDLLGLEETACEIVEFKTGERRDEHARQVLAYAVLWRLDPELNPRGLRATKLTLAYPAGHEDVPVPSEEALSGLANELSRRGSVARESVGAQPPLAQPAQKVCGLCGVRHLCREYWREGVQKTMLNDTEKVAPADIQAVIRGRHGATSWDATVEVAGRIAKGTPILIRCGSTDLELPSGQQVRLLDAWISDDTQGASGVQVVSVGLQSEVYLLDTPISQ